MATLTPKVRASSVADRGSPRPRSVNNCERAEWLGGRIGHHFEKIFSTQNQQ
ncbi:hypothetical protein VITFI_CDS3410 (plasmid) [Vitreoscilla filiformis]|uniref:Uncharacterized protein n=1 Tax=Vitreoscilla filiformis TaxID=63 RepID=A0A221KK06_VITFI|nr:hypothetical protein VITFI_CDS3410 [Vitreoscilla filiformis]